MTEKPAPGGDLRDRLRDALETEPHLSVDDVVTTVMRLLAEQHGDLRDQIRDALIATALRQAREKGIKLSTFTTATIRANAESLADAVLPVVEAETADLRKRLAYRHGQWQRELDARIAAEQRAEQAEAALAAAIRQTEAHADIRRQREIQRDQAERQRDEALAAAQRVRDLAEAAKDEADRSLSRQFGGHPFPPFVPVADVLAALDQQEGDGHA